VPSPSLPPSMTIVRSIRPGALSGALGFFLAFAPAAALLPPAAPAQESAGCEGGEGECAIAVEGSGGVVVTGTRTEHAEDDAPVPTQVIDHKEIEAAATDNVEVLLSQIPDLYVRRNEEFGLGASTIRMQGLDANKTAILIDGRRFRGGVEGVVDLRDIAVGGVEQIEVVRGPASSLYGSDAMSGVVNIRTRSGSEHPYVRTETAVGTRGRERLSAAHGYQVGPLQYFLSLQHDAVAIADLYGNLSSQYEGENADDLQERDGARLRLDGGGGRHTYRFVGDCLNEKNPLSESDDLAGSYAWTWQAPRKWTVETDAGFYRYSRTNDLEGFAEDVEYYDFGTDARASRPLGSFLYGDHFLSAGLRVRQESLDSAGLVVGPVGAPDVSESVNHASPYFQTESLLGADWSLVLGLSADHHERYGFDASPRATLTWRPRSGLTLSATVGRGYRAPDLLQLYDVDINNVVVIGENVSGYAIVGNPDLEPETDIGTTLFASYSAVRGVRLTFDAFRHDLEDGIGFVLACTGGNCTPGFDNPLPDLDGPVFTYQNVASAVAQGLNGAIELAPLEAFGISAPLHALRLTLGAGYLHTENQGDIAGERGKALPFRPEYRVLPSIDYAYAPTGTSFRLWGELNGRQYSDFANTDTGEIPSYFSLGLRVRQSLGTAAEALGLDAHPSWKSLHFFVHADNLTGEDVAGGFGPLGPLAMLPRRNVQAGLIWTFGESSSVLPEGPL
jgi:outer membrane receptor for ferrienterochelin and colicin